MVQRCRVPNKHTMTNQSSTRQSAAPLRLRHSPMLCARDALGEILWGLNRTARSKLYRLTVIRVCDSQVTSVIVHVLINDRPPHVGLMKQRRVPDGEVLHRDSCSVAWLCRV